MGDEGETVSTNCSCNKPDNLPIEKGVDPVITRLYSSTVYTFDFSNSCSWIAAFEDTHSNSVQHVRVVSVSVRELIMIDLYVSFCGMEFTISIMFGDVVTWSRNSFLMA